MGTRNLYWIVTGPSFAVRLLITKIGKILHVKKFTFLGESATTIMVRSSQLQEKPPDLQRENQASLCRT